MTKPKNEIVVIAPASTGPASASATAPAPAPTVKQQQQQQQQSEEELTEKRNEAKKRTITEKTEDAYWRAMKRIKRGLGLSDDDGDMDFLLDYDTVHAWIEELGLSPSSKKTYYIAIHHTIENLKDPQFSLVAKQYDTDMMAYIKKTQREPKKKDIDTITWNEILEVRKTLEKKALKDAKNFLLDYVILCMYTYLPPSRCEYVRMKVYKGSAPAAPAAATAVEGTTTTDSTNYILLKDRSAIVVFSDHASIKVPYALVKVLHMWTAFTAAAGQSAAAQGQGQGQGQSVPFLFVKVDGKPMLKNTLSQRILSIFQRETKKKLGINAIRKAYVSSVRNEVAEDAE